MRGRERVLKSVPYYILFVWHALACAHWHAVYAKGLMKRQKGVYFFSLSLMDLVEKIDCAKIKHIFSHRSHPPSQSRTLVCMEYDATARICGGSAVCLCVIESDVSMRTSCEWPKLIEWCMVVHV